MDEQTAAMLARLTFTDGYDQGYNDGTHPSGVVTHLRHRDPEAWNMTSKEYQRGYEQGWADARGE